MGCTNTKVHPVDFNPVPQAKETWKIAWPEQPSSVKTVTQSNEDAVSVKTAQNNEDAVSVKTTQNNEEVFSVRTTQNNEDALSVKTTQSNKDAVSVKTTQNNEDAVSVKTTQSNEDALSVKTTQSNEDALSGDSSFSDDVSDVSTLTTESETESSSSSGSFKLTTESDTESSSSSGSFELTTESDTESSSSSGSFKLTTESDTESSSSSGSFELTTESDTESSSSSGSFELTTESDTESSSSSGSFESAIDLTVSPPKPSRGQTTPVPKTREDILLKNIARAGFQIDPVARDGDCFFRSAARQLGRGDPSIDTTPQQLRKDLVHHIRAHSEKFCVAVPGGFWAFQQELDKLARRGHWCSDLADVLPIALADFTAREVNLITSTEMEIMTLPPEGEESGTPLVLSYLATPGGEHYDAVKFVGG
uniref:Small ribosomal subunit protein mS31 n=1 Tax=Branchiostoma floridae TaxID=7739 RepID=C3XS99_BRAFL|eukprot:XP_002613105.1 hypothetical protein BRAFLDRAFT_89989 [Branchiostoma floridae]